MLVVAFVLTLNNFFYAINPAAATRWLSACGGNWFFGSTTTRRRLNGGRESYLRNCLPGERQIGKSERGTGYSVRLRRWPGRVKTPTLAIACKRELEIRDFSTSPIALSGKYRTSARG